MKLSALFYFVLSLFGCDVGRSTFVDRVIVDGGQALYSKATVEAGVAHFECVRSASGHCHYTLFPRDCEAAPAAANRRASACESAPIERFVVANGDSRQITGLGDFRLCVSAGNRVEKTDCSMPGPMASR